MITPSFSLTATERVLPKLALDFTTASLDSRVTFTRTTSASNPATYVANTGYVTAATNNEPRFDFDPVTLACKGLLIEEIRQNLLIRSQEFNVNAPWVPTRCSVSSDVVTSPDGTSNADKIVINTTPNTTHRINYSAGYNAGAYTVTVFAKKAEKDYLILQLNTVANGLAWFNLNTGALGTKQAGLTSSSITNFGNGWYRCSITATLATGTTDLVIYPAEVDNVTTIVNGDGTSGIYIWGAQLEAGAFATSYIPTTSAALTRNADVATMTGTNFSDWYDAGAGGVVACVLPSTVSGTRPALQFDDATANEVITLRGATTNPELVIVDGGSPQAQIDAGTIAVNTVYNLGAAWNTDDCAAAVNGGAAVTDNSAIIPTVTQARLGSDGSNYLNGHLQTLRYWPQRIINAEVQAFSK